MITYYDGLRILQFGEQLFFPVRAHIFVDICGPVTHRFPGQFRGYIGEIPPHHATTVDLPEIVYVQLYYVPLDLVYLLITLPVYEGLHRLRHSADRDVFHITLHHHGMSKTIETFPVPEYVLQQLKCIVPIRPEEFFEVHRVQSKRLLFARDDYVLHVPLDGYQRTGLNVIVSTVLDQGLDGFPCTGKSLDLVEDHQCISFLERPLGMEL